MKQGLKFKGIVLMMGVALISSCAQSIKVTTDYDRTANFTAYKTFSFYALASTLNVNELNQDRIIKSIRLEMLKKGFTENNYNPDLVINAITVLKDKKSLSVSGNSYGGFYRPYGYWGAPGYATVQTNEYKDGRLIIDIADTKTKKLVWEGTGVSEITKQPKDLDASIGKAVGKIMAGFPAGTSAK
jgi:Domain of unknown function (DUF4136)